MMDRFCALTNLSILNLTLEYGLRLRRTRYRQPNAAVGAICLALTHDGRNRVIIAVD